MKLGSPKRRDGLGGYWRGSRGAAAAEFALVLTVLTIPVLNVADIGSYVFERMDMQNAVEVGAQEAGLLASTCTLPLTKSGNSCAGTYSSSISAAVHGGSLGTKVTVSSISENYYCVNASGNLYEPNPGNLTTQPTCTDGKAAGDYVLVTGTYSYTPIVSGVTVAGLLTMPSYTAWIRIS